MLGLLDRDYPYYAFWKPTIKIMTVSTHICVFCFTFIVDTQAQESTLGGGVNRHCFYGLQPDSDYKISVYTKLQEIEGPSVSIMQRTRKSNVFWFPSLWANSTLRCLCIFPLFKKVVVIAAQEYGQCTFFSFTHPKFFALSLFCHHCPFFSILCMLHKKPQGHLMAKDSKQCFTLWPKCIRSIHGMWCVKLSLTTIPSYHSNEGRLRANTFQLADPRVIASLTGGPCAVF